jgi:hypothetical protein
MMNGDGRCAQIGLQFSLASGAAAGAHFGGFVGRKSGRIAEPADKIEATQQRRTVFGVGQDIRIHPGRDLRVAAREPHFTAAARVEIHHAHGEAVT